MAKYTLSVSRKRTIKIRDIFESIECFISVDYDEEEIDKSKEYEKLWREVETEIFKKEQDLRIGKLKINKIKKEVKKDELKNNNEDDIINNEENIVEENDCNNNPITTIEV